MVDLHTTDGAKFEQDISINVSPVAPRSDQLDETASALRDVVVGRLTELGHLPVAFYPSFVDDADPRIGVRARRGASAILALLHGRARSARDPRRDSQLADVQGARGEHVSHAPGDPRDRAHAGSHLAQGR